MKRYRFKSDKTTIEDLKKLVMIYDVLINILVLILTQSRYEELIYIPKVELH